MNYSAATFGTTRAATTRGNIYIKTSNVGNGDLEKICDKRGAAIKNLFDSYETLPSRFVNTVSVVKIVITKGIG